MAAQQKVPSELRDGGVCGVENLGLELQAQMDTRPWW